MFRISKEKTTIKKLKALSKQVHKETRILIFSNITLAVSLVILNGIERIYGFSIPAKHFVILDSILLLSVMLMGIWVLNSQKIDGWVLDENQYLWKLKEVKENES